MAQTHCQRCGTDVEDAGGFCLLGHRLSASFDVPPPPPPPAMGDLTAAVDRVFEAAAAQVQAVVETAPAPEPTLASRYMTSVDQTWAELESTPPPSPDDPINTFAPPPRMDWGPQRSAFRFKLRRQRAEAAV